MKIRLFSKMIFLTGSIFILMAIVVGFSWYSFYLNNKKENFSKLEVIILETSQLRMEMLIRRDSNFTQIYQRNYYKILINFKIMDSLFTNLQSDSRISELSLIKKSYSEYLNDYVQSIAVMGLNEDDGVEGKLRESVHLIEKKLDESDLKQAYIYLLQARRREKDFIMRHRFEYVQKVDEEIQKVVEVVRKSRINQGAKEQILDLANNYIRSFRNYVQISDELNRYEVEMHNVENRFKNLIRNIVASESSRIENLQTSLVYLFALALVVSILLAIIVSRSITKPVIHLQSSVLKVSEGDLQTRAEVESTDEIGELAKFFNEMVIKLNETNLTIMEQQNKLNQQYDELRQMNITKDKFFSIIAHDLKNPISSFLSVSDFLVGKFNELSKEEIKEFLDEVHISAKNVYELLENLLLWSRSQRGLIQFNPTNLDLKTLIVNNINLLSINAEAKGISLSYHLKMHYQVFADPNMLNTILRNLITNSIKFTQEGGKIEVIAEDSPDNENLCLIKVVDTGVGISKEYQAKLFSLENNISTSGTRNEKGTGLGLILCNDFIQMSGGSIWVESEPGQGSTFIFTLPLIRNSHE